MFGNTTTLIVVYKDELLLNMFKKLIESNDDIDEEHIIGISDGSVKLVTWAENVWLDQKKAGNINNKVLFLGKVSGWDKLTPIIDVKFNEFGVKYGWAGNQAIIYTEAKEIEDPKKYNEFLDHLNQYNLPDIIKSEKVEETKEEIASDANKSFFNKVGGFFKKAGKTIASNISGEQKKKSDQQYFYGIYKFYETHLAEFIEQ